MRRRSWLPVASVTVGSGLQRGLGALLPLVLTAIATRQDGFEAAGVVGVTAAIVFLATAAADLGTTPASLRDFPTTPPTRAEFYALAGFKLIAGILVAAVLSLGGWVFASSEWAAAIAVASLSIPAAAVSSLAINKLAADGDGTTLSIGACFAFVVGCLVAAVGAGLSREPWALLAALPLARLIESLLLLGGTTFPRIAGHGTRYGGAWILAAWPLYLYQLLQIGYLRSQVIVPRGVLTVHQSGEVVDGFNLYSAATLLPGALALATWPRVSVAARSSPREGVRAALRYSGVSMLLILPPVLVLLVAPGFALEILYGSTHGSLETYVRWGAVATLFVGPNALMLSLLVALGQSRSVAACWIAAFPLAVVFLLYFSEAFGVAGAGFAVVLGEASLFALFGARLVWVLRHPVAGAQRRSAFAAPGSATIVVAIAIVAGAITPAITSVTAFPTPSTGLLLLLPLPFLTLWIIRALGYDLLSPAAIFALAWTSALAVAQLPLFPEFNWNGEVWLLVTVPPLVLLAGIVVASGDTPFHAVRGIVRDGRPFAPGLLVAVFAFAGAAGWANYFRSIGTIPLVSGDIDALRFSTFDLPTLILTRFGYVGLVVAIPAAAAARTWRGRFFFAFLAAVALVPLLLSGGRLYAISGCVIGAVAAVLLVGFRRWVVVTGLVGLALILTAASVLWFARVNQQPPNPFKNYLEERMLPARPEYLRWTIPLQMAASVSMQTLSDLVNSDAYELDTGEGLYSTKFLDRFVPGKDLEQVARVTARYQQVTSTYVGPWYADFGIGGAIALSLVLGLANGLVYRVMVRSRSRALLLLYAYCTFWLVFAIYLNYWSLHGVWLADVPLLLFVGWVAGLRPRPATLAATARPLPVPGRSLTPDR